MYYTHAHLADQAQVYKEASQGRSGLKILVRYKQRYCNAETNLLCQTPRESGYNEEMFFDVMMCSTVAGVQA